MVFESVLTYFLNKYLGPYVENLDTNQLNLGIWGGNVEFKNLVLKQGALDALDLPIQTVFGKIGKLTLKIPWKNLYGAEFLISLEDIYLLAEPNQQVEYDAIKEEKREIEKKLQQLINIEIAKKAEADKDKPKADYTFVEKLSVQIVKNIRLSIKNIHIRYEDKITRPEHPFSIGITLKHLEIVSTNEKWEPAICKSGSTKIYKILELEGLSLYWNTDSEFYSDLTTEDLCSKLPNGIESKNNTTQNKFILGPINATARIKMNQKPELDNPPYVEPSIQLNFDMEKLFIGIRRSQYYDIIALADSMTLMTKGQPFRKYRPKVPVKGHGKEWWHFAYKCILESEVRRKRRNWNWDHMKSHRDVCSTYKDLYRKKLGNKVTNAEIIEINECERNLDLTNLVIIRNKISMEIERKAQSVSKKKGWFNWMWGGSNAEDEDKSDIMKMVKEAMTPDEKAKLYKAIDYQENAAPAIFPDSFIQHSLLFLLRTLEITLFDDQDNELTKIVHTELSGVKTKIETRPAGNGLRFYVKIDDFSTYGVPQNEFIPQMITSSNKDVGLLVVNFELNPLNSSCNQKIHIAAEPLKIVYDAQTIIKITEIFTIPQSSAIDEVAALAGAKMQDVSQKTATGLQYAIDKQIQLDLQVDLKAPFIIVPYGGQYTDNENVLVINLGNIKMYSLPRKLSMLDVHQMHAQGTTKEDILQNILENCYDQFNIELTSVQVLIAQSDENWKESAFQSTKSPMHLLNPISLNIFLSKSLITDDPRIPLHKFTGQLPSIDVNMSDSRILLLLALLTSIPLPGQQKPQPQLMKTLSRSSANIVAAFQDITERTKGKKNAVCVGSDAELVQFTTFCANFEISELSVTISQQETINSVLTELAIFKLDKLKVGLTQKTYETNVVLELGGIALQQKRNNCNIDIISTKSVENDASGSLFTVNYIQANIKCPEFHSLYKSCEQQLILKFGTFSIILHQEGLLSLMAFATNLQDLISETQETKGLKDRVAYTSENSLAIVNQVKKHMNIQRKRVVVETIKLKLSASFNELTVLFATDATQICFCAIRQINSEVLIKETYTQVTAKLHELAVVDLNPATKHKLILKSIGNETISVDLVLNNMEKCSEDVPDMIINCSVGAIRIVFLNWFVTNMLNFLNNFQTAQQSIVEASRAAASSAKENMKNAYAKAVKCLLDVNLKAPIIIVPVDSNSFQAIYVDLGKVMLSNKFTTLEALSSDGFPAVIDELSAKLENLKISQVILDEDCEIVEENNLLMPLSTTILIKRNLSTSWYNLVADIDISVNVKSIDIILRDLDYQTIMDILSGNLAEGTQTTQTSSGPKALEDRKLSTVNVVMEDNSENTHEFLKFTFIMDTFNITLLASSLPDSKTLNIGTSHAKGLGGFSLKGFSMKGRILTDQSIVASMLLMDCVLTDIREGREDKLNKLIHKSLGKGSDELVSNSTKSMIDVTFQKKGNDMFADIRVFSMTIILSVDYLMKLQQFFNSSNLDNHNKPVAIKTTNAQQTTTASDLDNQAQITANFKLEKPDIILVEHMDDINTKAIILNNELLIKFRSQGEHQVINGTIKDLTLFTSVYNPTIRESLKKYILNPVTISLAGSTPQDKGLHLELIVTEFRVNISPTIIELLTKVINTATAKEDTSNILGEKSIQYQNLWDEKPYDENDYWYLKPDIATEVLEESIDNIKVVKDEMCLVTLPSVTVTLEVGVGRKTVPMILLETSLIAKVKNWSSQLNVDASLTMEIGYYNSQLALWEPLMEPVTIINNDNTVTYKPWELKLEMSMSEQEDILSVTSSEDVPNQEKSNSVLSIDVKSEDSLEMTVTKTCLEVLTNIGNAFASAMNVDVISKSEDEFEAPYKVLNETGLPLTLLLKGSPFEESSNQGHEQVVLENMTCVYLQLSDRDANLTVKLKHQFGDTLSTQEYILTVLVAEKKSELAIPVLKSEKRCFLLNYQGATNEKWGIVSDVVLDNGTTIITLRSVLTVYNHFEEPVEVYYMTAKGNEVKLISTIQPREHFNVPVNAVYTPTNELFFAVKDFSVTNTPYIWKDLKTNLTVTKVLQCSPRTTEKGLESFVIKAIGEMEQVYYENTTRHTMASTCYNIHLRPAVTFTNCLPVNIDIGLEERNEEIPISPGDTLTLRYVIPGKSALVIKLPDYLEKEWVCRSEINDENEEFGVWSFNCHEGEIKRTLELGVHFVHYRGSLRIMLYCPFWMLNKTGLMLGYRKSKKGSKNDDHASPAKNIDDINILHHPPSFKGPVLFSFTAKNFFGKKKAAICVDQGKWSDKFSLDVAGSSGTVICEVEDKKYQIGVHNQLTYNGLSKQITFTPYYVVMNNASFAIDFQEFDRPGDPWSTVEPKSCKALWPVSDKEDKCLRLRVHGADDVTSHFLYTESHTTLLRLNNIFGGISVDVQLTEGAVYVNLAEYEVGMAPALIVNHTEKNIQFWEKEHVQKWELPPKHCILYTWLNPSGPRRLVWERKEKKEVEDDLRKDSIGEMDGSNDTPLFWTSFLDGMQRILLFTEDKAIAEQAQSSNTLEIVQQEITISIQGIGLSIVNNLTRQEIMYVAIASSGIIWEQCKLKATRYKQFTDKDSQILERGYQDYLNLLLDNKGVSGPKYIDAKHEVDFEKLELYKPNKRKIRRSFQTGLWLNMKTSPSQMQVHAKINRIQIDNQMYDCIFPVILAPVPPPKSVTSESGIKPFIELSIVQLLMKNSQIKQYKYFKVLVQEFHVKVEMGFINAILELIHQGELTLEHEKENFLKDTSLVEENLYSHAALQSLQEQKNFYDLLHFSPLKIHISFSLAGDLKSTTESDNIIKVLLQGVGVTLTDMNDVEFKLAYFERDYIFLTKKKLISEATTHYAGQLIKQLYVLILGLDVLGNPYGLVLGITKGVEDLFYEPFQGAIQGPGEFAEGLVLGVRSLLGHTVGGAAGAVSKITGAVGKGLAALTFDKDYQRKRRDQMKKKPTSTQEHLARGGKGVVMGVLDGVSGVFTKPVTGAKEEGIEGFFKGLGKGAIGLVARPTAGIVDFASSSFDVVKRATDALDETRRLRPPRYIPQNGHVVPFNSRDSKGQKLLFDLDKGKYAATDIFLYFEEINKKEVVLLTDKRLAYVNYNEVFGAWQIDWSYTWQELVNPAKIIPKGISITISVAKKKLFKSGDQITRLIAIVEPQRQYELFTRIESLRGA